MQLWVQSLQCAVVSLTESHKIFHNSTIRSLDSQPPPSHPTLLLDTAALSAPLAAISQPITDIVEFNFHRPGRTVQVKIEPSDSPPLSHILPSNSTYFKF